MGVLKVRVSILKVKGGIPYPYETQVKIVMVCCIIHNFIRKATRNDELFGLYEDTGMEENRELGDEPVRSRSNIREDERVAGEHVHGNIARQLWTNHQQRTAHPSHDD